MNRPRAQGCGGSDAGDRNALTAVENAAPSAIRGSVDETFRIHHLRRVAYGSKVAEFELHLLDGQVVVEMNVFAPPDREIFVAPASVRCRYSGTWQRRAWLGEGLSSEIVTAVRERLSVDESGEVE